jgi:hypothetical protein
MVHIQVYACLHKGLIINSKCAVLIKTNNLKENTNYALKIVDRYP